MKQTAKVTAVDGNKATVEVNRTSACSECGKNGSCFACKSIVTSEAKNEIGAVPGDTVTVESSSVRIVGYAAAVFVMPIAAGIFCFYILSSLVPENSAAIYILPTLLFAFIFAAVCVYLNRKVKKNPDITITAILHESKNDGEG
ncbi:MAG: SoxR reducing system RseC family protein [Eubacteriales bacterium]